MINDLVANNKYYCFLNPSFHFSTGKEIFELLIAGSTHQDYYGMYYDNIDKNFKLDGERMIEKTDIYSKIIGTFTGFHKYSRNEKHEDGYYLITFSSSYMELIKIMNNKPYGVELLKKIKVP